MSRLSKSLIALIDRELGRGMTRPLELFGCEVGTWRGDTSRELLKRFDLLHLLMVDRYREYDDWEPDKAILGQSSDEMLDIMREAAAATAFAADRRMLLVGDSAAAAAYMLAGHFDFVFIDGGHSYEAVSRDLAVWYDKVAIGGLVCGHDYDGKSDRRGRFGVKKAVDEFAGRRGYRVRTEPALIWWFIKRK